MRQRANLMTDIVQRAQKMYPERLQQTIDQLSGGIPYGKERIDQRTYDKRVARMTEDDLTTLAQSDPLAYMDAVDRLRVLRSRASQDEPQIAPDAYEGEQ